jgi:hypothetical protein
MLISVRGAALGRAPWTPIRLKYYRPRARYSVQRSPAKPRGQAINLDALFEGGKPA